MQKLPEGWGHVRGGGGQGRRASDDPAPSPSEIMAEGTGQRVKCLRALKFWEHLGLSGDGTISQYSLVTD